MKWLHRGLQIGQAVKNAQRLRQILGAFAKHGFVDIVERIHLGKFLPSLIAALDLLAEGKSPTRSNFREKGIYSSTEASGAVNLLASLGYVDPVVQGAPADWADGVAPANVAAIADHLRSYVPALPIFQPVFAEIPAQNKSGGQQAGRGGAKRR
jgi:hypothetical protein